MHAETAEEFLIRPVVEGDIPTLVKYRTLMFRELGWRDEPRLTTVEPLFATYLAEMLEAGGCSGFLAEQTSLDGPREAAGGVVLVWQRVPPSVRNLAGVQAYLLGMYVAPGYRRRGLARRLAQAALECAVAHGAPLITLHASEFGRPLYEELGFQASPEMRLFTELAAPPAWGEAEQNTD